MDAFERSATVQRRVAQRERGGHRDERSSAATRRLGARGRGLGVVDASIEEWGLVEGGHDVDQADITVRLAAPRAMMSMLRAG